MRIPEPTNIKALHFVGIGGIGMSGIAEVFHSLGYHITGSDLSENSNILRLRKKEIAVFIGHDEDHIKDCQVVIISSAIKNNNPEVLAARKKGIPVIPRAEMLAELMRLYYSVAISGTHGKTTTTSLTAAILEAAHMDPTIVNGGIINSYKANAYLGKGIWSVVEADESDGSFIKLFPTIAVITNIDHEHLDFYKTFDNLKEAFHKFASNVPFYGAVICCTDHPEVEKMTTSITDRTVITYGFNKNAMVRAVNIKRNNQAFYFDVHIQPFSSLHILKDSSLSVFPSRIKNIELPMFGEHNIQNALAAIAVAIQLKIDPPSIKKAFKNFKGVKRRFTKVGESSGITVIDDYAHHPVEINTVLAAAKGDTKGRVIVVVQPHRYSRLKNLFKDFVEALSKSPILIVTPVYEAGEDPLIGFTSVELAKAVRKKKKTDVYEANNLQEVLVLVDRISQPGDMILCMGAGSITQWASLIPSHLDKGKSINEGLKPYVASSL